MSPIQNPFPSKEHCLSKSLLDLFGDVGKRIANIPFKMRKKERLDIIAVIFDLKIARFESLGFFAGSANCV